MADATHWRRGVPPQAGFFTGLLVLTDEQEKFVPQSFSTLLNTHPDPYISFAVGRQSWLRRATKNIAHTKIGPCWFDGSR